MRKREAEQNIEADWEIDAFMTADTAKGKREAIASEYILRILGLDVSIPMLAWDIASCTLMLVRSGMLDQSKLR